MWHDTIQMSLYQEEIPHRWVLWGPNSIAFNIINFIALLAFSKYIRLENNKFGNELFIATMNFIIKVWMVL